MTMTPHRMHAERLRLLGLRRGVHYKLASRTAHVPARLPVAVITGTKLQR